MSNFHYLFCFQKTVFLNSSFPGVLATFLWEFGSMRSDHVIYLPGSQNTMKEHQILKKISKRSMEDTFILDRHCLVSSLDSLVDLFRQIQQDDSSDSSYFFLARKAFMERHCPDVSVFSPKEGNSDDVRTYTILRETFNNDDAFILHNYRPGLDRDVVVWFADALQTWLESGKISPGEAEKHIQCFAHIAFINWTEVERKAETQTPENDDPVSNCKQKIHLLKNLHANQRERISFLVVNRTMGKILLFHEYLPEDHPVYQSHRSSAISVNDYLETARQYFLELQTSSLNCSWKVMEFVLRPNAVRSQTIQDVPDKIWEDCDQYQRVYFWKEDFDKTILRAKILQLAEGGQEIDKGGLALPNKLQYERLVSNIIVLARLQLLPQTHAIRRSHRHLTGLSTGILGPGDAMNVDFEKVPPKFVLWTPEQQSLLSRGPSKVIISSDYGTGKSMLVHHHILDKLRQSQTSLSIKTAKGGCFLISFLDHPVANTRVRSVLDVFNKMRYENTEGMKVIDSRDILCPESKLREQLGLPRVEADDNFKFLMDLTAKYTQASIGVDEVMLTEVNGRERIYHEDFEGTLWVAVSSVDKYDFRNMTNKVDLLKIPAVENQTFESIHLTKNMRNASRIFKKSFELDGAVIELATRSITDVKVKGKTAPEENKDEEEKECTKNKETQEKADIDNEVSTPMEIEEKEQKMPSKGEEQSP